MCVLMEQRNETVKVGRFFGRSRAACFQSGAEELKDAAARVSSSLSSLCTVPDIASRSLTQDGDEGSSETCGIFFVVSVNGTACSSLKRFFAGKEVNRRHRCMRAPLSGVRCLPASSFCGVEYMWIAPFSFAFVVLQSVLANQFPLLVGLSIPTDSCASLPVSVLPLHAPPVMRPRLLFSRFKACFKSRGERVCAAGRMQSNVDASFSQEDV